MFGLDKKLKAALLEDEDVVEGLEFTRESIERIAQSLESIDKSLQRIAVAAEVSVAE